MGVYATTTSIPDLIPNFLSGNTTTSDTQGTQQFSKHIDRAEATIDGFISTIYPLPFITGTTTTNVPPLIRTLTEDIACYYALRSAYTQDGASKNPFYEAYKVAMDTLKEINQGKIKLVDTAGSLIATQATNRYLSNTDTYTPIFGKDDPKEWGRDPDEILDQENARANT
jgi:phage gp36-like protein